jgi:hypothetical protein
MLYGEAMGSFSCVVATETQSKRLNRRKKMKTKWTLMLQVPTLVDDVTWEQYDSAAYTLLLLVRIGSPLHSC